MPSAAIYVGIFARFAPTFAITSTLPAASQHDTTTQYLTDFQVARLYFAFVPPLAVVQRQSPNQRSQINLV
jgi:hypothetical protein